MANPEHVEVVKRGADAIEAWRREHPGERLDLGEADLGGANLFGANLFGANLSGANLSGANLSGANLSGADLSGVNFTGTDLRRATLERAVLGETVFADTNLAGAKGLETARHWAPSTIDHRTSERSGDLPLAFLRGCGLPDDLIDFYTARYGKAIQFYSCFISYSTKDQELADRLHADLQDNGVRCWLASEDLKTGDPFRDVIDQAIRVHDKLLLILSEHSIASAWVQKEVETAFERERNDPEERTILFPIRVDEAVMETDKAWAADIRRTRHIGDFIGWDANNAKYVEAFERVLRDLRPEDS
jgi:uncharacterized protein YjbI with pentapeptide repeats